MSIAMMQKVRELDKRIEELLEQAEELESRLSRLESGYNGQHTPIDPPRRRGRPPKHENV